MDLQVEGSKGRVGKKSTGDKRSCHRHTLALETEIHFREQSLNGMFRCVTSNIGLLGAFLPAEHLPITSNTEIDVVLHARTRPQTKQYRLHAKLVRMQDDGAAVAFCPKNEDQIRDFRRFLLKAKVAARK